MKITKFFALALAALAFVACDTDNPGEGGGGNKPTGDAVLVANNNSVEINTPIEFTVTAADGTDLTAEAVIYDKSHDYVVVENPFTPTFDGDFEFYAVIGSIITNTVKVSVVPTIPALPEDAQPENTAFNHRILLVDHTGNTCGYCPQMMKALETVSKTGDYHSKYYEAMAHTYSNGDPAFSGAANVYQPTTACRTTQHSHTTSTTLHSRATTMLTLWARSTRCGRQRVQMLVSQLLRASLRHRLS